jgi:hypothetical protein
MSCAMALRGVSPSEKLLLLALANYADENMKCYPSQRRLADDTCLSDRTIRSLLAALEARQMLSRTQRSRPDGSRSTDIITLQFAGKIVAESSGGTETASGGVGKPFPGGTETASGLTTFEPSSNHQDELYTPVTPNGVTAPRGADKARGTRLPDGWMPEGSDWELALDLCNGDAGAVDELDRFLDYWRAVPGAKARKADWPATWRNWVRRASQTPSRKANDRPHNDAKLAAKNANYARAWTGSERASGRDWEP